MEQPKQRRQKKHAATQGWTPTDLQQAFVEEYLRCWNAAEAARKAGYVAKEKAGWRLLKNEHIKKLIAKRMAEITMETNEVLLRLTQQARVDISEFVKKSGNGIVIDWDKVLEHGYMVKKISYTSKGQPVLEFHDAQRALELIGRAQGMFVDRSEVKVGELNPVQVYLPENNRGSTEPVVDTEPENDDAAD